jgi:AAA domain-containing protein
MASPFVTTAPPPPASQSTKAQFIKGSGAPKVLAAPRSLLRKGNDDYNDYIKLFLFGPLGSGKTYTVKALLELGYKVLVLTTDLGGTGTKSVRLPLRRAGRTDLLDNLFEVELSGFDNVVTFLKEPQKLVPEIYDLDIDVLFWDGYSAFQQVDMSEHVGDMTPARSEGGKEVAPAVEAGLQFEQAQWGQIRNGTVRTLDWFCAMHNNKTGKRWHKIVTAHESLRNKNDGKGGFVETKEPLLQGAGGKLAGGAFDLVIRTYATANVPSAGSKDEDKASDHKHWYITKGHQNLVAKNRGFDLPTQMEGNFEKLWTELVTQLGLPLPPKPVAP